MGVPHDVPVLGYRGEHLRPAAAVAGRGRREL
jgi:hypothetical protein